jgi:hypothetical protein
MAISLKSVQPNKPKIDLEEYFWLIMGVPKGGKTSLLYKLAKKKFNGDLSKLLLFGFEKGYTALTGIHAVDIPTWEDFQEYVDQLIEEKEELTYKLLGFDTIDIMWSLAEEYIIKKQSIADKKRYKTISDIAWGQGWGLVAQEVGNQVNRLRKAGYGVFAITHIKEKKFETRSGVSYDKYTATLNGKARELFIGQADFVLFLDVTKEKEGEDLVDKRYIYFRTDGTVEAGSRFANVPEKIEYDIDLFIETFENAVLSEYNNDTKAVEQAKKEQRIEKEREVQEFIESEKESLSIQDYHTQIGEVIANLDSEQLEKVKKEFKSIMKTANYKNVDDAELLQQALNFVNGL